MKFFKKLIGKKCYLSPISTDEESIELFAKWFNDFDMTVNLGMINEIINKEKEKSFIDELAKKGSIFAIVDLKTDKLIGSCGIFDINQIDKLIEFGISIGDKDYRGKGYGKEAINLLLDFGFNVLNYHNIMLRVFSFNTKAMGLYKKLGFKEIGRRREAREIGDKRFDLIFMDMLKSEFTSPYIIPKLEEKING